VSGVHDEPANLPANIGESIRRRAFELYEERGRKDGDKLKTGSVPRNRLCSRRPVRCSELATLESETVLTCSDDIVRSEALLPSQ
jgi:hypothetical protein